MGRFSNLEFGGQEPPREQNSGYSQEARDENYYLRLAEKDYRAGRFEKALRHYSRTLEYNANLVAAWVGQVQMLVELGEAREARLWSDKALEVHRDHPEILSAKAVACARLGEPDLALQFSDAAMAQKGTTPGTWLARGEALLSGRRSNDEYCFENAASASRHDAFVLLRIGRTCHHYGHHGRGMAWALKSVAGDPASAFAHHVLGECRSALGLGEAAEDSWRQALALDPDFGPSRAALDRRSARGWFERLREGLSALLRRKGGGR